MRKIFKGGIITSLILVFIFSGSLKANAISVQDYLHDNIVVDPGGYVEREFGVVNNADTENTFYFTRQGFGALDEYGAVDFLDVDPDDQMHIANWLRFPESITLGPNEARRIKFGIEVPDFADPGGHYAMISVTNQPVSKDTNVVYLKTQVSVLILITVTGDIEENLEVVDFSVKDKKWFSRLPVTFETRVRNEGTVHMKPIGYIKINGPFHDEQKIEANPTRGNVMPKTFRRFESAWTWHDDLKEKQGFFKEFVNEYKNFAFGKYTAELHFIWGKNNLEIRTVDFWVIPWHLVLAGLGVLILIYLVIFRPYHWMVKRKYKKEAQKG